MKTVTAAELLILDGEQFRKEYYRWQGYCMDDSWYEFIESDFKETVEPMGIGVESIQFSGFYCQGSYASFEGRVNVAEYMKHHKLDEQYLALYLASRDDGSYIRISPSAHGNMGTGDSNMWGNQTAPSGVFKDLPQRDWEDLVDSQINEANMEDEVLMWCIDLARDLFKDLQEEYEHQTSEESFIESCECNDITFEIESEEEEEEES